LVNPRKDLATRLDTLGRAGGKKYWRSLEELADRDAFRALIAHEYSEGAPSWPDALSRRGFLARMGASLGTAVLSGMIGVNAFRVFLTPVFFFVLQWLGERRSAPAPGAAAAGEAQSLTGGA
jgi:MoCo/4Fe-4S cofactor protein with predicted Tat translocation signal